MYINPALPGWKGRQTFLRSFTQIKPQFGLVVLCAAIRKLSLSRINLSHISKRPMGVSVYLPCPHVSYSNVTHNHHSQGLFSSSRYLLENHLHPRASSSSWLRALSLVARILMYHVLLQVPPRSSGYPASCFLAMGLCFLLQFPSA